MSSWWLSKPRQKLLVHRLLGVYTLLVRFHSMGVQATQERRKAQEAVAERDQMQLTLEAEQKSVGTLVQQLNSVKSALAKYENQPKPEELMVEINQVRDTTHDLLACGADLGSVVCS